jgi:hypothetical protein
VNPTRFPLALLFSLAAAFIVSGCVTREKPGPIDARQVFRDMLASRKRDMYYIQPVYLFCGRKDGRWVFLMMDRERVEKGHLPKSIHAYVNLFEEDDLGRLFDQLPGKLGTEWICIYRQFSSLGWIEVSDRLRKVLRAKTEKHGVELAELWPVS